MTDTKPNIRIQMIVATTVAAIGLAAAAQALADPVDLNVVDRDTGQTLQTWRHHGRLYVVGRPGDRYSLRVTNHTGGRVLVVMSVDGVNILTGETADYGQRGYVFSPGESYDVTGWRKSNTEVAAFNFAPLSQSYAARTGRPTEVGVIGMAVFNEKVDVPPPPPEPPETWREGEDQSSRGYSGGARGPVYQQPMPAPMAPADRAAPAAAAKSRGYAENDALGARRDEKLGTGHGAREWSVINTVAFERATSYPQFTRQIEYDTYAHLVAAGVIVPYASAEHHPQPFPSHPDGEGYVPDPPD
jgi:hypothetical protein